MELQYYLTHFKASDLLEARTDALASSINSLIKEKGIKPTNILQVDTYIEINSIDDYSFAKQQLQQTLNQLTKGNIPAFSLIPQIPANNESCIVITYIQESNVVISYKEFQKHNYTVCNVSGNKTLFSGFIDFNAQNDPLRSTQLVYDFMEQLLDHEEMHFGHLINCNTTVDKSFLHQKYDDMSAWQLINQVQDLYFDPTLFKQSSPLLGTSSMLTAGIGGYFVAANKDSFPIYQDFRLNDDERINARLISDWNQINISGLNTDTQDSDVNNDNIITQCKTCVSLLQSLLSGGSELKYLKIYIQNVEDLEDTKMFIEQQLKLSNYHFIITDLSKPLALVEMEAVVRQ